MLLNDYSLKGFDIRISAALPFDNDPAAGQTSSSTRVNKGIKPKELTVGTSIKFEDAKYLTGLISVAESVDSDCSLTVYNITETTANTIKIKQVQFIGVLNIVETEGAKFWRVTFKLAEYLSVPEIVEKRQDTTAAEQQTANGETVADVDDQETEELTGFESFLAKVDKSLA